MKPKIHYVVRHAQFITNKQGDIDVQTFVNKAFEHQKPIIARKHAFDYYERIQEMINYRREMVNAIESINDTVSKGNETNDRKSVTVEDSTDIPEMFRNSDDMKKLWQQLNSFYSDNPYQEWSLLNPQKASQVTPHGDAVVALVKDDSLIEHPHDEAELIVHRTIDLSIEGSHVVSPGYDVDELMLNLDIEYELYEKLGYDTANQSTKIYYWDSERYYEGLPHEKWADWHTILKTPFDWAPFSKENWWNDPEFFENHESKKMDEKIEAHFNQHEELIKGGETETIEFKPLLFGTIPGKDKYGNPKPRDMALEVAQVICSFMNKNGGNIYIGVKDNGDIIGADLENRNNEDHYQRVFSTMKKRFFGNEPIAWLQFIEGRFITVEGKRLFCITVKSSHDRPVFLHNKSASEGPRHEFYIREGTSSLHLYDAKYLAEYIEEKWWRKKYQQS